MKIPIQLGEFLIVHNFVARFNCFERLRLVVFKYHMFIMTQQVVSGLDLAINGLAGFRIWGEVKVDVQKRALRLREKKINN